MSNDTEHADHPSSTQNPVRQLRLIVEAEDFDAALAFYRDALGLTEQIAFQSEGDARVAILEAGRATLELANPTQKALIDDAEVGRSVSRHVRVAFEVDDADGVTRKLAGAGATVLAEPTTTPWRSRNARLEGAAGLQLTLFEELDTPGDRAERDGFATSTSRSTPPN